MYVMVGGRWGDGVMVVTKLWNGKSFSTAQDRSISPVVLPLYCSMSVLRVISGPQETFM